MHGEYAGRLLHPLISCRLEPAKGGRSSATGDNGSHWCEYRAHVIGQRVVGPRTGTVVAHDQAGEIDEASAR